MEFQVWTEGNTNWDIGVQFTFAVFLLSSVITQAREKISRTTFEQKLRHPLAAKLRKKIEEWMSAFQTQDLRAMVAETQVRLHLLPSYYCITLEEGFSSLMFSMIIENEFLSHSYV